MTNETVEYDIRLYERGPNSCEWKVWPKTGPAVASGVAKDRTAALKAAGAAKERLEAKRS